jgi:uncharacterized membrane protein YkvA (DUF1232 family)
MDWKAKAKSLKKEVYALYLCSRHPRTPFYAKVLAVLIVAYALSPLDLIPDFIPILGCLDDLVLIPAGVALLLRLVPRDVLQECRCRAEQNPPPGKMRSLMGAILVAFVWLLAVYIVFRLIAGYFSLAPLKR